MSAVPCIPRLAMVVWLAALACRSFAASVELSYTEALVQGARLQGAVRSLRASVQYAEAAGVGAGDAASVLAEAERVAAAGDEALQADAVRPEIEKMDFDGLRARCEEALARVQAATEGLRGGLAARLGSTPRRQGFVPPPPLSTQGDTLRNAIAFAALAPSQKWKGWQEGAAAWDVLRVLDLQAVSPWLGWYWQGGGAGSWAQAPERMEAMLARMQGLEMQTLLWLEPEFGIDFLWDEIGEEMYLHDAEGKWQKRTRINNTINVFHPRVREAVCDWLRKLTKAQAGDARILGYELIEEAALRFDVSAPESSEITPRLGGYSQAARAGFRARLEQRYGTVAELNSRWGTGYGSFGEVAPPAELRRSEGAWTGPEAALLAEFQEFRAMEHAEYFRQMVAAMHEGNPAARVLPQFVTPLFGDPLGGVDLFRMSEAGWDVITYHTDAALSYMHSVARYAGKPVWNDEYIWSRMAPREATGERGLRAIAATELWRNLTWGSRGFVTFNLDFTWESAKDGGDWNNDLLSEGLGDRAPRYAAAAFPEVLRTARSFGDELRDSEVVDEGLMILEPTTSVYVTVPTGTCQWWARRLTTELGKASYRPAFCPERYLTDGREDLSRTRVVVVPVGTYTPEEVCRRLWEWASRGGTVIALGPFASFDEYGRARPAGAPFGALRPGETVTVGAGRLVQVAFSGTPEAILAAARAAVDEAIGPRAAVSGDQRVEVMLRVLPDEQRLVVALNADPMARVQTEIRVAGEVAAVTDITVECGMPVPVTRGAEGVRLAVDLEPGEARAFLLE